MPSRPAQPADERCRRQMSQSQVNADSEHHRLCQQQAITKRRHGGLARQYALDYLITEQHLDLPVANRAGPLLVYALGS